MLIVIQFSPYGLLLLPLNHLVGATLHRNIQKHPNLRYVDFQHEVGRLQVSHLLVIRVPLKQHQILSARRELHLFDIISLQLVPLLVNMDQY